MLITNNDDFQAKQMNLEALVREKDGTIKSLKERLNAAENSFEDGNKLLKQCVNKRNCVLFLGGQQKIELGQKQKKKMSEKFEQANKKCKDLVQPKQNESDISEMLYVGILSVVKFKKD